MPLQPDFYLGECLLDNAAYEQDGGHEYACFFFVFDLVFR